MGIYGPFNAISVMTGNVCLCIYLYSLAFMNHICTVSAYSCPGCEIICQIKCAVVVISASMVMDTWVTFDLMILMTGKILLWT